MTSKQNKKCRQAGFTIIELLVSLAIFGILAAAVLGGFAVLSSTTKAAREKTILSSLASQYLEIVRNMPYNEVGTQNGNPQGQLPDFANAAVSKIGAYTYKIFYEIAYVDDPADGTILGGNDSAPNDYKQVKMSVLNTSSGQTTSFFTSVVPQGLESMGNAGALLIKVLNAQGQPVSGASVNITSQSGTPAIVLDRQADASGQWLEVGLPAAVNGYRVTASKSGYTTDQTYPLTAQNPNPTKPDATIATGQVTQASLFIDIPATLAIKTLDSACQAVSGVNLNISGAKLIGTTPDVFKFNQNFSSAGGQVALNNLEWDTYTPLLLTGQSWVVRGTSPIQKIDVLPGSNQVFSMILDTNSTPHSLLVVVKDAASAAALEGATVSISSSASSADPWYQAAWEYRKSLIVSRTKVSGSGSLANFPLLFSVTDPDLRFSGNGGKAEKSDGTDIVFTSGNGTAKLDHELEYYNPSTGQVVAWVRLPSLSSAADTPLYVYFGNGSASDQQNAGGVWDGGFKGVWHLKEGDSTAAGFYKDSTAGGSHATLTDSNGNSVAITGKIDGAINLNGDADYLNAGSAAGMDNASSKTVSFWVRRDTVSASTDDPLAGKGQWGVHIRRSGGSGGSNTVRFVQRWSGSSGQNAIWRSTTQLTSTSALYYVTVSYDGSSASNVPAIYVNGQPESVSTVQAPSGSLLADASDSMVMGASLADGTEHDGILDEVRYSDTIRSADWIKTEYNNQSSPATFYSYGGLEVPPAAPGGSMVSGVTGGSIWLQNNWTGSFGQETWTSAISGYSQDNGNVEIVTEPSGIRLKNFAGSYLSPGWLESSTFDTGTEDSNYTMISWQPTSQDPAASVRFQLASSANIAGPWNYAGPDGSAQTYYEVPGTGISTAHDGQRYIRYKAFLDTTDPAKTPILSSVGINYVSGCFTPGQVWFGGLSPVNYSVQVVLPGYQTVSLPAVNVNGNQSLEVLMNP